MYNNFFGLKEKPFKLVPNPAYLFLSKSHEEALAHLTYAVSQGDGFVEITGEVGTGKTTLCRAFLENLDDSVDAAYIFNPKLDALQLLQAINDEFGIDSSPHTIKELLDVLNDFLITCKGAGKKVLLLVDEAQNLGKDVLEQLRLLSNLETTQDKLLQIILVGQPELATMLDSHELRQLGQRITLSCRLTSLSLVETQEYVLHRLAVAALRPGLKFDFAAVRRIHKYARGVPRLINIVADRALLIAYGCNSHVITEDIVRTAIRELAGAGGRGLVANGLPRSLLMGIGFGCVVVLAVLFVYRFGLLPWQRTVPITTANIPVPAKVLLSATLPASVVMPTVEVSVEEVTPEEKSMATGRDLGLNPPPTDLVGFLATLAHRSSRRLALQSALAIWDATLAVRIELDDLADDQTFFRVAAEQNGLMVRRVSDFNLIRSLGLPSVLALRVAGATQWRYLAVEKMSPSLFTLQVGDQRIVVTEAQIRASWSGVAYVPWKNFLHIIGTIPRNAPVESVLSFKMLLRDVGWQDVAMTPEYDENAKGMVLNLQKKYGLEADGKVGPLTKIILYREANQYQMPQIFFGSQQLAGDSS